MKMTTGIINTAAKKRRALCRHPFAPLPMQLDIYQRTHKKIANQERCASASLSQLVGLSA
jgi:hypothetical protein